MDIWKTTGYVTRELLDDKPAYEGWLQQHHAHVLAKVKKDGATVLAEPVTVLSQSDLLNRSRNEIHFLTAIFCELPMQLRRS
jgi:hypothetical protein